MPAVGVDMMRMLNKRTTIELAELAEKSPRPNGTRLNRIGLNSCLHAHRRCMRFNCI